MKVITNRKLLIKSRIIKIQIFLLSLHKNSNHFSYLVYNNIIQHLQQCLIHKFNLIRRNQIYFNRDKLHLHHITQHSIRNNLFFLIKHLQYWIHPNTRMYSIHLNIRIILHTLHIFILFLYSILLFLKLSHNLHCHSMLLVTYATKHMINYNKSYN